MMGLNFADIDECNSLFPIDCHENSTCIDTFGSYECICNFGFSGNGTDCSSKFFAYKAVFLKKYCYCIRY